MLQTGLRQMNGDKQSSVYGVIRHMGLYSDGSGWGGMGVLSKHTTIYSGLSSGIA